MARYENRRRRSPVPVIIITILIIALCIFIALLVKGKISLPFLQSSKDEPIDVETHSPYVSVMRADGAYLYEKGADEPISPASTTKLLTALTALDSCSPEDIVTVGSEIWLIAEDSSVAWLNEGDVLTMEQLLVALLLPSGNDAAHSLAVYVGRQIENNNELSELDALAVFIDAMNKKAKSLGAKSSSFKTPDGYEAEGQYTTANDLSIIAESCLKNDIIMGIVNKSMVSEVWAGGRDVTYNNSNALIVPDSPYYYPNAVGMKTGYSGAAGACLVSAAVIDGETYICTAMGGIDDNRYVDSLAVFREIENQVNG